MEVYKDDSSKHTSQMVGGNPLVDYVLTTYYLYLMFVVFIDLILSVEIIYELVKQNCV